MAMVRSMLCGLSRVTSASCAPQFGQKYRAQLGEESYCAGVPLTQAKVEAGTVIQVVTMPPLTRRQIEQWQWAMSFSGPLNW
ncbi:hypothetical protein EMIT0P12_50084 [Pseudomonas sp. IT-P12]